MKTKTRVVFTQGGKGGVAKTEVVLSLIPWYRQQGIQPVLLDYLFVNSQMGQKDIFRDVKISDKIFARITSESPPKVFLEVL